MQTRAPLPRPLRQPRRALFLAGAAALAAVATTSPTLAAGASLRADLVEAKSIKLDGIPKEWSALAALAHPVKGAASKADLEARAAVAYDATNLYVAADVTDDVLRGGGGDYVELVLGFPGGAVHEVRLYPGDPGKSAGAAKTKDGAAIAGAKVIEAPRSGGWTLEAVIPWSALPPAKSVRVGLRGALLVADADKSAAIESIVGTAPSTAYASLPSISTETEQSLADGLLKDKGLRGAPRVNLLADVAGDAMKERVLVYDRYLVVLGSNFRKGKEYFWSDLGVDVERGMLPLCEARDVTGDGQAEIVIRKRLGTPSKYRERLVVLSFGASDAPSTIFQHEVGVANESGSVTNEITFTTDGGRPAIRVTPGAAKGLDAGSYHELTEASVHSLLLPWGAFASRTFRYAGGAFSKAAEEAQAASPSSAANKATPSAPPTPATPLPKAPSGPVGDDFAEGAYTAYRRERGVTGKPRFDLAIDVAEDKQPERVLLHDRDLVIVGKSFRAGGYSFLTLSLFGSASDVVEVTASDLTGDGKAEIIVKGIARMSAPPDLGGTIDREIVLVFQVDGAGVRRVFAAETARAHGQKRVSGTIAFVGAGKARDIELGPGKAVEWTASTYPFPQDTGPVSGVEPLLLPWNNGKPVRYRWNGSAFSR